MKKLEQSLVFEDHTILGNIFSKNSNFEPFGFSRQVPLLNFNVLVKRTYYLVKHLSSDFNGLLNNYQVSI